MAVRKRRWKAADGTENESWIVDYRQRDSEGNVKRHIETFARKKDADARAAAVKVNIAKGTHVAPSQSVTIREAAGLYMETCWARVAANEMETTTAVGYESEIAHLLPLIGHVKLSQFTVARARSLEDTMKVTENKNTGKFHSSVMVRRCLRTLGSIFADAQERGLCATNPLNDLRRKRTKSSEKRSGRDQGKLKIGTHIPTPEEVRLIIEHADPDWRVLLMTAALTGLRASELRGLRWANVDFNKCELHVVERADRYRQIGKPKSRAGERTVPLWRALIVALKEWRLRTPGELVFPAKRAVVLPLEWIVEKGLHPAVVAAGLTDKNGKPKYTGMHSLRHFFASWCLDTPKAGGLGLAPKTVQTYLGHSTISMTLDTYGHLLPRGADSDADDAADKLLGTR